MAAFNVGVGVLSAAWFNGECVRREPGTKLGRELIGRSFLYVGGSFYWAAYWMGKVITEAKP